jgi:hypothetical protein
VTPEDARKLSENIIRRYRGSVLGKIKLNEKVLDDKYQALVDEIAAIVRSHGDRPLTGPIQNKIRAAVVGVIPLIEQQIKKAALTGNDAARAQAKAIFKNAFTESFKSVTDANRAASARLAGRVYRDGVSLSSRLWRNHKEIGRRMAGDIMQSVRAGKSIAKTADELLRDFGNPLLRIPKYIDRIAEKAKAIPEIGSEPLLSAIGRHSRKLRGARDDFTIRVQTEQFLKEIKTAQNGQIDKIVNQWTMDRMRKHARMIARHETIEAYKDSYQDSISDKPYVKGIEWRLSPDHKVPDPCDILAKQNLYGLGPGGYPVDKVPATPHPNDKCLQIAIIDVDHFKRLRAEKRDEEPPPTPWKDPDIETGQEWLQSQSKDKQLKILGPTRQKIFNNEPGRVLTTTGNIRKVRNILTD